MKTSGRAPTTRRISAAVCIAVALGIFGGAGTASAHEAEHGIVIGVDEQKIVLTAPVQFEELGFTDTSGDGLLSTSELDAQRPAVSQTLVKTVRDSVDIAVNDRGLRVAGAGVPELSGIGGAEADAPSEYVVLVLVTDSLQGDAGDAGGVDRLALDWHFASPTSQVILSHPDGALTSDLDASGSVTFSLDAWSSATSFFALGVDHIQFGPDHLLFLLVLTLAVAGSTVTPGSAWRTLKLVTAFTLGHAVSLCLASFDLVSIPAGVVEPAISLSIVAAAALVIRGRSSEARPWIAAVIGLVHGLGFASSLASLGIATAHRAFALAAFNVGIDVAQTAFVLLVLGSLWVVGKTLADRAVWVRLPTAACAGLLGLAWTASRLTEVSF